jgi:hypothetical protein
LVGVLTLLASLGVASALADAPPTVAIAAPSEVIYDSAHLSGSVDPNGGPSSTLWHFEYREASLPEEESSWTQFSGDGEIPAESEGVETGETPVADTVFGLKPGTEYLARLVATNEEGANRVVSASKAFTTDAVSPPEARQVEVSAVTSSSAHLEGVVNSGGTGEGEAAGSYRFECQPACPSAEASHEFGAEAFADGADHTVQVEATGLEPGTAYLVKLIATNAGGEETAETAASPSFTTTALAPGVVTGTNTPEGQGKVLIRGYVNPRNDQITSCEFLWGPTESYGQSTPCEGDPGAAGQPVEVTAKLSGLEAGKTFHFALVAESAAGPSTSTDAIFATLQAPEPEGSCPNEARREEQHSTFLPECRAYEMVSPADKNGGDVLPSTRRTRAAASGDVAGFASLSAFGDARGSSVTVDYLAKRTAAAGTSGWSTHAITPQQDALSTFGAFNQMEGQYVADYSADFSKAIYRSWSPLTNEPNVKFVPNLYMRTDLLASGAGSYELMTGAPAPVSIFPPDYKPWVADATSDLSTVIFESPKILSDDAPQNSRAKLYEWDHGVVRYAGVLPESACSEPPCIAEASVAGMGAGGAGIPRTTPNTLSTDGSRVIFTVPDSGGNGPGALYMRIDHAKTVQINASERTDCADDVTCGGDGIPDPAPANPAPASYQWATPDGSKVFFTTDEQLTDAKGVGEGDLYCYDTTKPAGERLTLLSIDDEPAASGSSTANVVGASDDGSYVYFLVPDNQLVAGAPTGRRDDLYLWHGQHLTFIGALGNAGHDLAENGFGHAQSETKSSRVSSDGRTVLFQSHSGTSLTGYDHGSSCDSTATSNIGPCSELYLYRADDDSLSCVSCRPIGDAATGDASFNIVRVGTGGAAGTMYENNPLSNDGRKIFFSSEDPLVPEDTNGASDVYSYDTHSGSLRLLSAGNDSSGSFFMDATPDGSNVFIATRGRLTGWDVDQDYDLYDTRVNGGFSEPETEPAPCSGSACRPSGSASSPPGAGSAALHSPGNVKRPRCRLRRCARHHHRRHHGRRHRRIADSNQGGHR